MNTEQIEDVIPTKEGIAGVKAYATAFIQSNVDASRYRYHHLAHTERVVEAATDLCQSYELDEADQCAVIVAAWFHDTGFAETVEGHEEVSVRVMADYLTEQGWSSEQINKIAQLIRVTKMGVAPSGIMEQIIKDADCHHLGTKAYFTIASLLRDEWAAMGQTYEERAWTEKNIQFFKMHEFHTSVAAANYGGRKRKNLVKLLKQLDELKAYDEATEQLDLDEDTGELTIASGTKADRGVETMYRVTLRNHNQLSKIADNKSNIMLSINSIMLSILLSTLASKLDTNPHLILPTIVLTVTCVTSVIIAVLATRPKLSSAPYSDEAFLNNKFNMLFFGNFYQLPLDKFEWGVRTLMKNEQLLYGNLSKDLYFLGLVLAKKYRLLKLCYTIFMIGIVISSLTFVGAFLLYEPDTGAMMPELDE